MKNVEFETFKVFVDENGVHVNTTVKNNQGLSDSELKKIVNGILKELTNIDIVSGDSGISLNGNSLNGHRRF